MRIAPLIALSMIASPAIAHAGDGGNDRDTRDRIEKREQLGIPAQLSSSERTAYAQVFQHIRSERWQDAQLMLDAMRPGPLHAVARAELYTAKNSPAVALEPLRALLAEAPELPHASNVRRLAEIRGGTSLPDATQPQRLMWYDGAPNRARTRSVRSDAVSSELTRLVDPYLKADDGRGAEALVEERASLLTPDALTEWRQRVAWIYYVGGDFADARRVASLAQAGQGEWRVQADWIQGLASWRQDDCRAAQAAFQSVAQRATDTDLRAAGLYWASRADIACRRPDLVQARLQTASQYGETFYGMLSRQALGLAEPKAADEAVTADWRMLERRPNIRTAAALIEIGEEKLASDILRHQARIGTAAEHPSLTRLAGTLSLPSTQIWLSHNGPSGARPTIEARYPMPDWTPDGGWRVDKALVYAHALQESRFEPTIASPAGAYGIMQIMPAAATDIARARGTPVDRASLSRPSTNIEIGQSYLERLRDQSFTGGLLPKVIAAYNAGPAPVTQWNASVRANDDPLLYIESIPYWETRGYVMTVMRNYWMYERKDGRDSASRSALAQGMWPRFPGLPGANGVRLRSATASNVVIGAD
ncbi:lytic transglycosylase domain-containing protein [Sphingomonas sp. AX6]|uniref:lytic transglycosylase domain-containing protein n=1 Tax=Sphingomonas sp. AX6 TaxID=2653171 RepID=UPI0012EFF069|nr:lytic transglycosylase domain-containing protein [Sphingomonas sp. AX6]VXC94702.1 Lytic transglycosylase domain-containing protein [Sphingomonas sp. AX6]